MALSYFVLDKMSRYYLITVGSYQYRRGVRDGTMLRPHTNHFAYPIKYLMLMTIVCVVGFMYVFSNTRYTYQYSEHVDLLNQRFLQNITETNSDTFTTTDTITTNKPKLKYILQWNTRDSPFNVMGQGQVAFYKLGCEHNNCFVTDNRYFLGDITKFDAIAFSGKHLQGSRDVPKRRSMTQKYIFGATESAHNYRICDSIFDGFFNWTWTYRLDSDIRWGYITIYDLEGNIVGPRPKMEWPELAPVTEEFKKELDKKSKMVAWFVSHCSTLSKREQFVTKLNYEAKKYSWSVDIYGACGSMKCPRGRSEVCYEILKENYYFYLSFENSFAVDYVTEKLLNALNNDVVPVVFGAADYSRFLPPGSYLDARELGPAKLAATMEDIIRNKTRYYDFFRWKNHFTYKETFEQDVCNLCSAMNDEKALRTPKVYEKFRRWWNDDQWDEKDRC